MIKVIKMFLTIIVIFLILLQFHIQFLLEEENVLHVHLLKMKRKMFLTLSKMILTMMRKTAKRLENKHWKSPLLMIIPVEWETSLMMYLNPILQ